MNGLRLKVRHWVGGELGWSCLGVGMGELLGGGDRLGGGGGLVRKTSNLVVKLNITPWGTAETDACVAEFGTEWRNGFKGIRLEGL